MENGVMMQFFEWYLPNDGNLWSHLASEAQHLHDIGVTSVWIPPAYKADEQADEGYATYDLWDFGEFDQKGTVRTKYGTRAQLEEAIGALHSHGIQVYLDTVLNHKAGGDEPETFPAVEVDASDRMHDVGEPHDIKSYTLFRFDGRNGQYSDFEWHWYHFAGVDYDEQTDGHGIYRIVGEGKGWSRGVDDENGNYDYLLCNDLDLDNPEVVDHLCDWGRWMLNEFGFDGVRMDAAKHMDYNFMNTFIDALRADGHEGLYAVAEYWNADIDALRGYLSVTEGRVDLFDVPLHYNFFSAGLAESGYDMSTLLENALCMDDAVNAVTFVDNHDSQLGQSLESEVAAWFKPIAYAFILLLEQGYPCVFYGDYYGIGGESSPHRHIIDVLLDVRRRYAYGEQQLVMDHPSTVALIRYGDEDHEGSGVVLVAAGDEGGEKRLDLGTLLAGSRWREATGNIADEVTADAEGLATFPVSPRNISVWVRAEAPDR